MWVLSSGFPPEQLLLISICHRVQYKKNDKMGFLDIPHSGVLRLLGAPTPHNPKLDRRVSFFLGESTLMSTADFISF